MNNILHLEVASTKQGNAWKKCVLPIFAIAMAVSGCSTDSAARLYTEQNQAAQLRQEAENTPAKPDNKGMYIGLIKQMQAQGLFFASLAHIDAFEQQFGSQPEVQRLRGDALRETKQPEVAEVVYRSLLKTSEASAAWHGLGLLAGQSGNFSAAVPLLQAAAKREPTNPIMLNDLGFALLRSGDKNGARVPLAQAAELAPDNRKIIANLALLLLVSGDFKKAGAVMDQGKISPDSRVAIYLLADQIKISRPPTSAPATAATPLAAQTPKQQKPANVARSTPTESIELPTTRFQTLLDRFGNGSSGS
ncbi:tetratricopeptide repeat protein [Glaciimonas sp. PCH181]|uniref:tetratricopeptide repeat protein n=1 Tax=Glaciimonas sp. PCH181 TaxID=2133943 RepID=UPI000D3D232A|nr:tetratricopeptide repeat protein [Glaciimonas sp. PCH181]PUA19806.1 pilus assembly protein [Glaciimonas sp. PCH181]